jgi:hypothetical protein
MNNNDQDTMEVSVKAEQVFCDALLIEDIQKRYAFIQKSCMDDSELQHAVNHLLTNNAEADNLFGDESLLEISAEDLIDTLSSLLESQKN